MRKILKFSQIIITYKVYIYEPWVFYNTDKPFMCGSQGNLVRAKNKQWLDMSSATTSATDTQLAYCG